MADVPVSIMLCDNARAHTPDTVENSFAADAIFTQYKSAITISLFVKMKEPL
jgi:hypothetical protein